MLFDKGEIGRFPMGRNGSEKYDLVYLGGIFPNLLDLEVYNLLFNDYVFLFSTRLNINKDSDVYGHVNIDLVKQDQLSYFNQHLRDKANYHIVEKEPIKINDFLEIIPEGTEHGVQVFAHLKMQNILNSNGKVTKRKNFRILLVRENNNGFDNLPQLELGPEFQATVERDKAEERLSKLLNSSSVVSSLPNRKKGNAIEIVMESLNKEVDHAKKEYDQAFNNYLAYRRSLEYIH